MCRAYADSKTLTEDKRESLFEAMHQDTQISSLSDVLSAGDISENMLSRQVCHDSSGLHMPQNYFQSGLFVQRQSQPQHPCQRIHI